MKKAQFNYEDKIWGGPKVEPKPTYIQGLKLKYTLEDLNNIKGKVLDIGCGGGNMAKAIKRYRPDLDVWGVDISNAAIEFAGKNPQKVKFKISKAEKLPFKNNMFDTVLMYDVLEHLERPDVALKEAYRILDKGGKLHVFSPLDGQPYTLPWVFYSFGWRIKDKYTGHVQLFSDKNFTGLVEKNGFKLKSKRFSFHYLFSIFDISYFVFLELFHFKPKSSIEGEISYKKNNVFFSLFGLFYKMVIALGFYESSLLKNFPGAGGHYLFEKI